MISRSRWRVRRGQPRDVARSQGSQLHPPRRGQWLALLILSPHDPNTLYFGRKHPRDPVMVAATHGRGVGVIDVSRFRAR
jgi:hypothetical protein